MYKAMFVSTLSIVILETIVSTEPVFPAADLINKAFDYAAPFTQTGLQRFHANLFGSGRSTRATDIVVFNKSNNTFKMTENECLQGGWSNNMFPEHMIQPHTSVVYGAENLGFMTSCQCFVKYNSTDNSAHIFLETTNPYWSKNTATAHATGVTVLTILGKGTYNTVQYIME